MDVKKRYVSWLQNVRRTVDVRMLFHFPAKIGLSSQWGVMPECGPFPKGNASRMLIVALAPLPAPSFMP